MHKALLVLGLLQGGPKTGYDLHRIVRAHGEFYADLKKANLYYLLERLAGEGCLEVQAEPGARGPRRERLVYSLTGRGQQRFGELLRDVLRHYTPIHSGVEIAILFLARVPDAEAITLLERRREAVSARRAQVVSDLGDFAAQGTLQRIAADHLLSQLDGELAWTDRALAQLRDAGTRGEDNHQAPTKGARSGGRERRPGR
jgi:DNA-binding PadR family transcriptional regulator